MGSRSAAPDDAARSPARSRAIPAEFMNMLGTAGALLGVVAAGSAFSAVLPQPASPWLFASAYGAPGAIAFAVYWWIAQRL